ncbi:transmembrane protein Tmp21 homologue [Plasmodium ovale wallikeri]|uniref:Transmembrane protein Tmp21 homologue n=1 Tax=Plasmodium ovale wallikeri TaxID=864142 RepID=A0A1A8ZBJ8_PLAOA|nr:transmembrane protein Tmp21 homologue [Plasmodium ovale wallikeri]
MLQVRTNMHTFVEMEKMGKLSIFLVLLIFLGLFVNGVEIYITLRPNKLKCIKERINKDTLVVSKFRTDNKNSLASIFIYDIDVNERNFTFSQKQPIFETINKHDIKTAFTTFYSSSYSFCAYNKTKKLIDVHFEIKYGTEARDYTKIAKTEHLNEATVFLKKIVDRMNIFHVNLKKIKADEEKEKKSNDKLNDTLMWFSMINILIIIIAAILQDFYFKRFFTSKKII